MSYLSAAMSTRFGWLVIASFACAGRGGGGTKIGEQDRWRLETALVAAEAKAEGYVAARTTALRGSVERHAAEAGPCTFALPPANALVRSADGAGPTGDGGRIAMLHFTLLPGWALLGTPPPPNRSERESLWARMGLSGTVHGQYELSLKYVKDGVARGTLDPGETVDKLVAHIERLGSRDVWDWELVVITDQFAGPKEVGEARFQSGEIVGRAVLWSYEDGRIRCEGPVMARNSDSVMSIKVDQNR